MHEDLKKYKDEIHEHLISAWNLSQRLQDEVFRQEGDSDLHRYISNYLRPNMKHWISGEQPGNMRFLDELFARREQESKKIKK